MKQDPLRTTGLTSLKKNCETRRKKINPSILSSALITTCDSNKENSSIDKSLYLCTMTSSLLVIYDTKSMLLNNQKNEACFSIHVSGGIIKAILNSHGLHQRYCCN